MKLHDTLQRTVPVTCAATMLALAAVAAQPAIADDAQVNVYNWSDYIAQDTVPTFEKQTGIKVRYDSYDSDDTLQAKLLAGSSGYDVVVPSSAYMARQIEAGVYQKLDKSQLPNLANLDPHLMKMVSDADPGNQYGVPWAWGTDGVAYNAQEVQKAFGGATPPDSWALVFDPENLSKLKSCGVSFLDSASDVFPAVLQYLHRNPNSTNPADYTAAYEVLKKVRPYITQFNSSGYINDLANNDVCIAVAYSGDAGIARRRAIEAKRHYQIQFVNPQEGGLLWFDMMAIPKDAPHPEAALKWINYIEDPKTSAGITNEVFYPTANRASYPLVQTAIMKDASTFPSDEVIDKMTVMRPQPAAIMRLQNRLWAQLKSGT
ncbi:polyamine ABC transporter substrate-binding protein [Paraburkholderia tropica]|uniref:Putrescine-binding periplasmic protein n=2 Tax=Burkholderiaceae TaxID=119060 RepID=A0ABX5MS78_9BURK|nr:putrescine transport system substrate-binding protein [Paraburkholderia tropica]PXX17319.1 spermidine/putrescine-binding protein [Paraburkholderia tropica]PZW84500.1 spermidine/putrescine-binding protein [Paraburkholderia tropica]